MSAVLADVPETVAPATTKAIAPSTGGRPWTFYVLATLFGLYVIALYGPMFCIYILSFQDIRGGLVFPMKGHSLHWFVDLFTQVRTGDVKGSFDRSIKLAVIVTVITVVVSFLAGLGFRKRFRGDTVVFYMMIGSLVAPGLVLGIGVGLICNVLGIETSWYTTLSPVKRLRKARPDMKEMTTVMMVTTTASRIERLNAPLTSPVRTWVKRSTNQCSEVPRIGNTSPPRTSWNDRI